MDKFPDELLVLIFDFLNVYGLNLSYRLVCRRFNRIVKEEYERVQNKIPPCCLNAYFSQIEDYHLSKTETGFMVSLAGTGRSMLYTVQNTKGVGLINDRKIHTEYDIGETKLFYIKGEQLFFDSSNGVYEIATKMEPHTFLMQKKPFYRVSSREKVYMRSSLSDPFKELEVHRNPHAPIMDYMDEHHVNGKINLYLDSDRVHISCPSGRKVTMRTNGIVVASRWKDYLLFNFGKDCISVNVKTCDVALHLDVFLSNEFYLSTSNFSLFKVGYYSIEPNCLTLSKPIRKFRVKDKGVEIHHYTLTPFGICIGYKNETTKMFSFQRLQEKHKVKYRKRNRNV